MKQNVGRLMHCAKRAVEGAGDPSGFSSVHAGENLLVGQVLESRHIVLGASVLPCCHLGNGIE